MTGTVTSIDDRKTKPGKKPGESDEAYLRRMDKNAKERERRSKRATSSLKSTPSRSTTTQSSSARGSGSPGSKGSGSRSRSSDGSSSSATTRPTQPSLPGQEPKKRNTVHRYAIVHWMAKEERKKAKKREDEAAKTLEHAMRKAGITVYRYAEVEAELDESTTVKTKYHPEAEE